MDTARMVLAGLVGVAGCIIAVTAGMLSGRGQSDGSSRFPSAFLQRSLLGLVMILMGITLWPGTGLVGRWAGVAAAAVAVVAVVVVGVRAARTQA